VRPEDCSDYRHIKEMEMKNFNYPNFSGLSEFIAEEVAD